MASFGQLHSMARTKTLYASVTYLYPICLTFIMEKGKEFNFEILHRPEFSLLSVNLEPGQKIKAETGAMVFMDPSMELKTAVKGGLFGGFKRVLARESFFVNEFSSPKGGRLGLAPIYTGDMAHIAMEAGERWVVASGGYMASSLAIDTDSKFQGFTKGFFSGESMFFLQCSATAPSDLFIAAYGAFEIFDLKPGESLLLDNGHLVAMEAQVQFDIRKVGGIKSTIFSGEGLVLNVTGPGKLITQTRSPAGFLSWVSAHVGGRGRR